MVKVRTNFDLLGNNRLFGVPATPIRLDEAPNIGYVLSLFGKQTQFAPVQAVSNADIPLTGNVSGNFLPVDGVNIETGDRLLLNGQNNPLQNGIYSIIIANSIYSLTRADDANEDNEFVAGATVFALGGNNGGKYWQLTTPPPIVLNSSVIQFSSINLTTETQTVRKAVGDIISDGITTEYPLIHSLNTSDWVLGVTSNYETVIVDSRHILVNGIPDLNRLEIAFGSPIPNGTAFRVVVIG